MEVGSRLQCLNMEQSETAKKLAEQEGEKFDQLFLTSESGASISKIEELSSTPSESFDNKRVESSASSIVYQCNSIQSSDSGEPLPVSSVSHRGQFDVTSEKCDDSEIFPKKKESCEKSSNKTIHPEVGSGDRKAAAPTEVTIEAGSGDSFSVPTTSFQFQADFKLLKHNQEAFINYFKVCCFIFHDARKQKLNLKKVHANPIAIYFYIISISNVLRLSCKYLKIKMILIGKKQ